MASKILNTRLVQKNDTSENWAKAANFTPLKGEMIVYTDLGKIKIGDGSTKVGNLDFINAKDAETLMGASLSTILNDSEAEIPTSKAVSAAISLMDSKIKGEIGTKQDKITTSGILQGDGSGNITAAQEEEVQLVEITPEIIGAATPTKVLFISLSAESWTGSDPYSQTVSISCGTEKSKVDIQPNATAVQQMINDGVKWIYIENNNGVFTAKAIGAQPSLDITVQVAITEVDTL